MYWWESTGRHYRELHSRGNRIHRFVVVVFFLLSLVFVYRSFCGMRIPLKEQSILGIGVDAGRPQRQAASTRRLK